MKDGEWMYARFWRLPEEDRFEIMACLSRAIKWRGHDASQNPIINHANQEIAKIVAIFAKNGLHLEEYT